MDIFLIFLAQGLQTAFWGGFIAALLGGSNYNIVGPTGALSGILAYYSFHYDKAALSLIAILSGLICLLVFILRIDKYVTLLPNSVMHGFSIGVAFVIGGGQIGFAFGLPVLPAHEKFYLNVYTAIMNLNQMQVGTFLTFLICLSILIIGQKFKPKFPWMITLASLGIIMGALSQNGYWFFNLDTISTRYVLKFNLISIPVISKQTFTAEVLSGAFSVAFVTILETLISAKIADTKTNTKFRVPQEVMGLGLANIASGTFGGFSATAALARTNLNIQTGATSRVSAVMSAIFLGILSYLFVPVLNYLSLAIVAAILSNVAIRMVEVHHIAHIWTYDKSLFFVMILSALMTIIIDPTSGILYGGIISIFLHGKKNSEGFGEILMGSKTEIVQYSSTELDIKNMNDSFDKNFPVKPIFESNENLQELEIMVEGSDLQIKDKDEKDKDEEDKINDDQESVHTVDSTVELPEDITNKYDWVSFRVPGELTYLNAPSHMERIKPFLHLSRFFIINLKYTYQLDVDGLDVLIEISDTIKQDPQRHLLITGYTQNSLQKLEELDWWKLALSERRVFPTHKDTMLYIYNLNLFEEKQKVESLYHDITREEIEEIQRHKVNMERIMKESNLTLPKAFDSEKSEND